MKVNNLNYTTICHTLHATAAAMLKQLLSPLITVSSPAAPHGLGGAARRFTKINESTLLLCKYFQSYGEAVETPLYSCYSLPPAWLERIRGHSKCFFIDAALVCNV
jgi:hypothetical protein